MRKSFQEIERNIEVRAVKKHVNLVDLVKSFLFFSRASDERSYQNLEKVGPFECDDLEKLSNEYLLAKFGVDTAKNGPLKVAKN